MPKNKRHKLPEQYIGDDPVPEEVATSPIVGLTNRLEEIRASSRHQKTRTAQTLAELEDWRSEIDATIAFLRAQNR
jgi:hypothetical protein